MCVNLVLPILNGRNGGVRFHLRRLIPVKNAILVI